MYTFCLQQPYDELNCEDIKILHKHLLEGNRLSRPKFCPEIVYQIMCDCWQYETRSRPDTKTIVERIKILNKQ